MGPDEEEEVVKMRVVKPVLYPCAELYRCAWAVTGCDRQKRLNEQMTNYT